MCSADLQRWDPRRRVRGPAPAKVSFVPPRYSQPCSSDPHCLISAITYLAENLKVNVVGTAATIDAFLPLVRKGRDKKIVIIGTRAAAFASTWSEAVTSAACKSGTDCSL